ncbi:hypothetical protein ColTof4_04527 [Colletotrichum tofieldiae]|nr:hypothetical protein ColTof3_11237 [Colletotrichum tofieldiae]GKT72104.1 hypothetical protein ColTof4_04527 [Colletotrichum tofieldiae]GKT90088.1 hypothetical protein Ct61P_07938 [Colletotrichum tofieldiae]
MFAERQFIGVPAVFSIKILASCYALTREFVGLFAVSFSEITPWSMMDKKPEVVLTISRGYGQIFVTLATLGEQEKNTPTENYEVRRMDREWDLADARRRV